MFINNQFSLDDLQGTCGKYGSIQCDGSGAIAIYNILQTLGKDISLENIIADMKNSHSLLFGGMGGLNPFRVRAMLKKYGVRAHYAGLLHDLSQLKDSPKFILLYYRIVFPHIYSHFQAGKLVKDKRDRVWIQLYNPFHRYINVSQFKMFENLNLVFYYTIE